MASEERRFFLREGVICLLLFAIAQSTSAQQPPVFALREYHREIREDVPVDTSVVSLTATDPDGDSVTYSIVNVTSNNFVTSSRIFRIIAATGEVRTAATLDGETDRFYVVFVSAVDSSSARLSTVVPLTVVLTDIDDTRPVITVLDRQIVFTDGQRPNVVNGLPVDLTRTVKLTDEDTVLSGLRRADAALRTTTELSYPLEYGLCDNTTQNVYIDICNFFSSSAIHQLYRSWELHNGAILLSSSGNVSIQLAAATENPPFARVRTGSLLGLYPLGHRLTITGWIRWRTTGGDDYQYLFVHSENDGSPRYHGIALHRSTNRFVYTYRCLIAGSEQGNCYLYFDMTSHGVQLNDNAWHFFALRVSLSSSGTSPLDSIQLWLDNIFFEQPNEVNFPGADTTALLQPLSEPAQTTSIETRISGRPNSASQPDNGISGFVGEVSQLTILKGVLITGEQYLCLIACGETLSFDITPPETITVGAFQGRERSIAITSTRSSARNFQTMLRTLQFNSREVPATSHSLYLQAFDSVGSSNVAVVELISDAIPPEHRPYLDLNGDLLPSVYFETTFFENTAGVAVVSSDPASLPLLTPGVIDTVTQRVIQINITLHRTTTDDELLTFNVSRLVGTGITHSSNNNGYEILLVGTSTTTTDNYIQALLGLAYVNRAIEPSSTASRLVEFTVSNSAGLDNFPKSFTTVRIILTNDAPQVDLDNSTLGVDVSHSTQENAPPIFLFPNITLTDTDSTELEQADLRFTPIDGLFERLTLDQAVLQASGLQRLDAADGSGRLLVFGSGSLEIYRNLLATVQWQNTKADRNTTTGYRNVTVNIYDHVGRISPTAITYINFQTINDPPVLHLDWPNFDFDTTYTEESEAVRLTGRVNITDPDAPIAYATIQLGNPGDNRTAEVLAINGSLPPGLASTFSPSDVLLNITGVQSTSMYIQVLEQVTYRNLLAEPNSSFVREFLVSVVDSTGVAQERAVRARARLNTINDNDPLIFSCDTSVREDAAINDLVFEIVAIDPDFGEDVVNFQIVGVWPNPPPSPFVVNRTNGRITLSRRLNYAQVSQWTIQVRVTDNGVGPRTDTRNCTVSVLNVNNFAPVLDLEFDFARRRIPDFYLDSNFNLLLNMSFSNYATRFTEGNVSVPITSQSVALYDVDTNSENISSVVVTLTNGVDMQNEFLIAAASPPSDIRLVGNGTYMITLLGPGNNESFVTALESLAYVHNHSNPTERTRIVTFVASDGELSSPMPMTSIAFAAVNDQPELDVNGGQPGVNFETTYIDNDGTAVIPVTAVMGGGLTIFDIDNTQLSSAWISLSNTPDGDREFLIVTASVPGITIMNNGTKTIRLSGMADEASYKAVLESVRYANLEDEPNPNAVRMINFTITDAGHLDNFTEQHLTSEPVYTRIAVELRNDHQPAFAGVPYTSDVAENTGAGYQVLRVVATDLDQYFNTSLIFAIANDGNNNGTFVLNENEGNITLQGNLDYERQEQFTFTISVNDQGSSAGLGLPDQTAGTTVVINIIDLNDNPPQFTPDIDSVLLSVPENVDVRTPYDLYDLNATDRDSGLNAALNFTILGGNEEGRFSLDTAAGLLTIVASLDRETTASYFLQIIVCDRSCGSGFLADYINVNITVIDVNDNTPIFDPQSFTSTVVENTAAGTEVPLYTLARSWSPTLEPNTYLRAVPVTNQFDSSSEVHLCDYLTITANQIDLYEFVYTDVQSCFTNQQSVALFSQRTILNRTGTCTPVQGRVTISDTNEPVDWLGIYTRAETINFKRYNELFTSFCNSTFVVTNRAVLVQNSAYLRALNGETFGGTFACPLNSGQWLSNRPVNVLTDIASCSENITVGNLGATWNDRLLHALVGFNYDCTIFYGLVSDLTDTINTRTDAGTVGAKLYVPSRQCGSTPSTNCSNAPLRYDPTVCRPASGSTLPLDPARVPGTAYDRDAPPANQLNYSLSSSTADPPTGSSLYSIDETSGVIRYRRAPDHEQEATDTLCIAARDNGSPVQSATLCIAINVTDVNDNAPLFDSSTYSANIDENTPSGTTVFSVNATDIDSGANGFVTYTILSIHRLVRRTMSYVSDNLAFQVVPQSTQTEQIAYLLLNTQPFDFEQTVEYLIVLQAHDFGIPRLSTTINITIVLNDLDDNIPEITVVQRSRSHLEDEDGLIPTPVLDQVLITDADTVPVPAHFIEGAMIGVTSSGSYSAAEEYLWLPDPSAQFPEVCISGNNTASLRIAGSMTAQRYSTLLADLMYENTAREFAFNDTAIIRISITDEPKENDTNTASPDDCFNFDTMRTFASVIVNVSLQERNDAPVYIGEDELPELPTLNEDPPSNTNIGRAVWEILDGNVTDEDDQRDNEIGNAVFGAAVIGTGGSVSGNFQFALVQSFSAVLSGGGASGTVMVVMDYDATLMIHGTITWPVTPTLITVRLHMDQFDMATVTVTSSSDGNFTASVAALRGMRRQLLGLLDNELLQVAVTRDGTQTLNSTLVLVRSSLAWVTIRSTTSPNMAALIGPGSRLRFQPAEHSFGEATATLLAWDLRNGVRGSLAHDTTATAGQLDSSFALNSTTINVTVLSVNDPPLIHLRGVNGLNYTTVYVENLNPVDIVDSTQMTIDDAENDPIVSVLVSIYGERKDVCNSSQECPGYIRQETNFDRIQFITYDLFQLGFFNETGTICKTWNISTYHPNPNDRGTSESNWQSYLRTAEFYNAHPEPYNHTRLIEFIGFDGKAYGPPAYTIVNITTFNDNLPTVFADTTSYLEGNPCTAITTTLLANDPDCAATILWANVTLLNETDGGYILVNDTFNDYNVSITYFDSWVYIQGRAPATEYQRLLKLVTYYNNATEPSAHQRTITVQIRDRVAESDLLRFILNTNLVSDEPPDLRLATASTNSTTSFVEDAPNSIPVTGPVQIADADSVGNTNSFAPYTLRVSVENALDGTHEIITIPDLMFTDPTLAGLVNISSNGSSALTITSASADLTAFIRIASLVRYQNTAPQPQDPQVRIIRYELEDRDPRLGTTISTPCGNNPLLLRTDSFFSYAYSMVSIIPVNDLPEVDLDVGSDSDQSQVAFLEEAGPVRLVAPAGGNITDLDNVTLQWLSVTLDGVRDGDSEILQADLQGTSIQTTTNTTGSLVLTGPDLLINFVRVLNSLTYNNIRRPQPTNGTRNATIIVNDGLGSSVGAEVRITVDIFNNAPAIDLNGNAPGRSHSVVFVEDGPAVQLSNSATITDSDSNLMIRFEATLAGATSDETLIWTQSLLPATQTVVCLSGCSTGSNSIVHQVVLESTTGENITVWQSILRSFFYFNRADNPSGTGRTVTFNVTDDKQGSAEEVTTVRFQFVNDNPEVDLSITSPGRNYIASERLSEQDSTGIAIVLQVVPEPTTTGLGEAITVTSTLPPTTTAPTTQPATTTPTIDTLGEAGTTPPQQTLGQGRKRRQLDPDDEPAPTEEPTTSADTQTTTAPTTSAPTTQAVSATTTQTTVQTTQATILPAATLDITAVAATTAVLPGQRGYYVRDSDNIFLQNLIVVIHTNAPDFEVLDIQNTTVTEVGNRSTTGAQFSDLLNVTFASPGTEYTFEGYNESDRTVNISRQVFLNDNLTIYTYNLEDDRTSEYENFLGQLQYRNTAPEPCCANSSSQPFVLRNLDIYISDGQLASQVATATVTIDLQNDNSPSFDRGQYDLEVRENTTVGSTILSLNASDADVISFQDHAIITYSLEQNAFFNLTTADGQAHIVLSRELNRENTTTLVLRLTASDGTNSNTVTINITLTDTNDNSPQFDQPDGYSSRVYEQDTGALVTNFTVTDLDTGRNGEVVAFISNDETPPLFTVDGNQGVYSLRLVDNRALDRERVPFYSLRVEAADRGIPGQTTTAVFNITVLDVNDNAPLFPVSSYNVTERESRQSSNTPIINLNATDADIGVNAILFYTFLSGDPTFSINNQTGEIFQQRAFDFENRSSYSLTVRVDNTPTGNSSSLYTDLPVNVFITDVNDNDPVFNESRYLREFDENQPLNTLLFFVRAEDPDSDEFTTITYRIVPGSGNGSGLFLVDANSGAVSSARSLDRETSPVYVFVIEAADNHIPQRTGTVTAEITLLDLNDNDPEFSQSAYARLYDEGNAINATITTITATDRDEGANAALTYRIESDGQFSINPVTGEIFALDVLDYDPPQNEREFVVNITATDGGSNQRSTVVQLTVTLQDINDNPPIFNQQFNVTISENQPTGTIVSSVAATDIDSSPNSDLTYTLEGPGNGQFLVLANGQLQTQTSLDREERASYSFTLRAADGGNPTLTGTTQLQISVLDLNDVTPQFDRSTYAFRINENISVSDEVGEVRATDNDTVPFSMITYTISDPSNTFDIDPDNGTITLSQPVDFERGDRTFNVWVNASDGLLQSSVLVRITVLDVNDNRPVITNLPDNVSISETNNGAFFTVTFTDDDVSAQFNTATFSITRNSPDAPGAFNINAMTGQVSTVLSIAGQLWIETFIIIQACNSGSPISCSDSEVLRIFVNRRPQLQSTYRLNLPENTGGGVRLGQLSPLDDLNCLDVYSSCLFFELLTRTPYVVLDNNTAEVYTSAPVNREVTQLLNLTVQATDFGVGRLSTMATLLVTILDANDVPPCFQQRVYDLTVSENRANEFIRRLQINDTDINNNSVISAELSGIGASRFNLVVAPTNGTVWLYTSEALDREGTSSYTLSVTATDMGDRPLNCSSTLNINVQDENDNCPIFGNGTNSTRFYSIRVNEFQPVGSTIYNFTVRDIDAGQNGNVRLEITPPIDLQTAFFRISGIQLQINRVLDLEGGLARFVNLTITATDGGQPACSTNTTVLIEISDENDNTPGRDDATATVTEQQTPPAFVFDAIFFDPDFGPNGELNYSLNPSSNGFGSFTIHPSTGRIETRVVLDREQQDTYSLIVEAVDNPEVAANRRTGTATITVTVNDINDNSPEFRSLPFTFSIPESSPTGTRVGNITAFDRDIGNNATLRYNITADSSTTGSTSSFQIDSASGAIEVNTATPTTSLDRETLPNGILLTILVEDSGNPRRNSSITANVTLTDINDNRPVVQTANIQIDENTPIGTIIYDLTATDDDIGINREVEFNLTQTFTTLGQVRRVISPIFSVLRNGSVVVNNTVDYETYTTIGISVIAVDLGSPRQPSNPREFSIVINNINDNRPQFTQSSYNNTFPEDAGSSTFVAALAVTDSDNLPRPPAFSIVRAFGQTNTGADFTQSFFVGDVSGIVRVSVSSNLDYETDNVVIVIVQASDSELTSEVNITVTLTDVNDNPPRFLGSVYSGRVRENLPSNSNISQILPTAGAQLRFSVSDADGTAANNQLSIEITEIGGNSTDFIVDGVRLLTNAMLDRENKRRYTYSVTARDNGIPQLSARASLEVIVTDENDNAPVFVNSTYSAAVREDLSTNTLILTVSATDRDDFALGNGRVEYLLNSTNQFDLGTSSGQLQLAQSLDRELNDSYRFDIYAYDVPTGLQEQTHTTPVPVQITVLDVDDNRPTITLQGEQIVRFTEDSSSGVSSSANAVIDDLDLVELYPLTALRAQLRTSRGVSYPAEGGLCEQALFGGVGAARTTPYTDPLDMCRRSGAINLFEQSFLCGTQLQGRLLEIWSISNSTSAPRTAARTPLTESFLVSLWFRGSTAGTLYSRYHNNTQPSFTIEVTAQALLLCLYLDNGTRIVEYKLLFLWTSGLDNAWHHIALTVESNVQLTMYIDGISQRTSNSTAQTATADSHTILLPDPISDEGNDIRTFVGGKMSCQSRPDGAEIAQVFHLNDASNSSELPCCIASCGESLSVDTDVVGLNISRQYLCTTRTLQLTALPTLPNKDSIREFQAVLRTMAYFNSLDEPQDANQTLAIASRDTLGYGSETQLTVETQLVNDKRPELYLGASVALNNTVTFVEDTLSGVTLVNDAVSLVDRDSGDGSIQWINVTLLNAESTAGSAERLTAGSIPNSLEVLNSTDSQSLLFRQSSSSSLVPTYSNFSAALLTVQYWTGLDEPQFYQRLVQFTVNDGSNVNEPLAFVHVNIQPVNDIPELDLDVNSVATGRQITYLENSGLVQLVPGDATLDDSDNTTMIRAVAELQSTDQGDVLNISNAGLPQGISSNGFERLQSGSGGRIIFTGEANQADYLSALRAVVYTHTTDDPISTSRLVTFYVNDGLSNSPAVNVTIQLVAVNDVPLIDLNGASVSDFSFTTIFVEEGPCVSLTSPTAVITDPDTNSLESLVITLTNRVDGTDDTIGVQSSLLNGLMLQEDTNSSNYVLNITGLASLAVYTNLLRSANFCNSRDEPSSAARQITFLATDNLKARSSIQTTTVSITQTNDAPQLSLTGQPVFVDNSAGPVLFTSASISDDDDLRMSRVEIMIRTILDSTASRFESLNSTIADTNSSIESRYTVSNNQGVLTLSFPSIGGLPIPDVVSLLRDVTYFNPVDEPNTQQRQICTRVFDGQSLSSNEICILLNTTLANDHIPVIDFFTPDSATITENSGVELVANATASDEDAGTDGTITFELASVMSRSSSSGMFVMTGTMFFTLIRNQGSPTANINTTRALDAEEYDFHIITVRVVDGGSPSFSSNDTFNVSVADVNDHSPQFAASSFTLTIREDTEIGTSIIQVSATDDDQTAANSDISQYILTSGSQGFFAISSQGVITLRNLLDIDQNQAFTIVVEARDSGLPTPRTNTTLVQITIQSFAPCYVNLTTRDYRENERSQQISPYITMGCRSRLATITQATITLPPPTCSRAALCQSTTQLVQCDIEQSGAPAYRIMDLARSSFTGTVSPTDAACSTAQQFIRIDRFNGGGGVVSSSDYPNLSQQDFTVAFRVKIPAGVEGYVLSVNEHAQIRYFSIYLAGAEMQLFFVRQGDTRHTQLSFIANLNDNSYHQVIILITGVTTSNLAFTVYIDCALLEAQRLATGPMDWPSPSIAMQLGRRLRTNTGLGPAFHLDGTIDSILIQQRIWNDEDIACMCTNGATGNCGEQLRRPAVSIPSTASSNFGRTLTFSGPYNMSVYETALRAANYLLLYGVDVDTQRSIDFSVSDSRGGAGSNSTNLTIVDTNNNALPVVLLSGTTRDVSLSFREGVDRELAIAPQLDVRDPDGGFLSQAVVYLSGENAASNEHLTFDSVVAAASQITVTPNALNTMLTFTNSSAANRPHSDYETVLRTVRYEIGSVGLLTGNPSRTVTFQVTDQGRLGIARVTSQAANATINIAVTANRNGPQTNGLADVNYTQGTASLSITPNALITDADISGNQIATQLTARILSTPTETASPITGLLCERTVTLLFRNNLCSNNGAISLIPTGDTPPANVVFDDTLKDGRVVVFNGQQHVSVPQSQIDLTGYNVSQLTVSLWFQQRPNNNGYALALHTQTGPRYFDIYLRSDQNEIEVNFLQPRSSAVPLSFTLATRVDDNNWHSVVVVTNGTSVTVYVDGQSRGTQQSFGSEFIVASGYRLFLGGRPDARTIDDSIFRLNGSLAGVHFYNRSLTVDEITCITIVSCFPSLSATTPPGSSVAVTTDTSLRQLTLNGNADISVYQSILRTLTYTNPTGDLGARNVTITITDSGIYTTSQSFTLTIVT